jgi:hypothetical protein
VRALSVRAPWAGLIASGAKTIEVRAFRLSERLRAKPLLICQCRAGAVAIVDVLDCRPFVEADDAASGGIWTAWPKTREGHWAWVLRVRQRVTSERIRGRLGFYRVDESLLRPAGP